MNKTYCRAAFGHIYSDSAGKYKLCCHAYDHTSELKQFNSKTHAPFEYFLSEAMEDIRNRMMIGEKIGGCEKCYDIEREGFESPRLFRYNRHFPVATDVEDVELKLRIFGNHCNLACYMCIPFNSSTRTKELKDMGLYEEIGGRKVFDARLDRDQWNIVQKDIIENIDLVGTIHITGGEPFLLPKHFTFIESIPEEAAADIQLTYDTNFTTIEHKGKSVFEYLKKFKLVKLNISCDHYGDKLSWIRYPIDVQSFEQNLRIFDDTNFKNLYSNVEINRLNVTTSILNVEDLDDIKNYYLDNFNIETDFHNVVNTPYYLNIKNHPLKQQLIRKYKNNPEYQTVIRNLKRKSNSNQWNYAIWYLNKLDNHRKTDYTKLWNYKRVEDDTNT